MRKLAGVGNVTGVADERRDRSLADCSDIGSISELLRVLRRAASWSAPASWVISPLGTLVPAELLKHREVLNRDDHAE
jgi:hypothetical protein